MPSASCYANGIGTPGPGHWLLAGPELAKTRSRGESESCPIHTIARFTQTTAPNGIAPGERCRIVASCRRPESPFSIRRSAALEIPPHSRSRKTLLNTTPARGEKRNAARSAASPHLPAIDSPRVSTQPGRAAFASASAYGSTKRASQAARKPESRRRYHGDQPLACPGAPEL